MKLRQNAMELVLLEVEGLGMVLGQIRYNKQTETATFALEKAAFFDLYFPCAVLYEQKQGPVVRPHLLSAMTTSSIRVQRSRVSCFVMETDLNPSLHNQYKALLEAVAPPPRPLESEDDGPDKPRGGKRIIPLTPKKE